MPVLSASLAGGLMRAMAVSAPLSPDTLAQFKEWIEAYGAWAPAVYIGGAALAEFLFVPALPLTLLGGIAFGPLWGTAYVSVASTLGAALSFLAARHALRAPVERWLAGSPRLARLDAAVAERGWRVLMVTRLVPVFPFNLQNFAYGLTRIRFATYVGLSWACMLPTVAAYTVAAGALAEGGRDPRRMLGYLGAAGVLIVAGSLIPRWLERRSAAARVVLERP